MPKKSKPTRARTGKKRRVSKSPESRPANSLPAILGELDLHLFGEGRHELIYQKLGAHVITHEGVKGVSFAVWAPAAAQVSVVGNFNDWEGGKHPMRALGSSGVWETFIPGLQAGELYKYQINTPGLPVFLKADPYASFAEEPPDTSSIVYESSYRFRDARWLRKRNSREHFRQPLSIYEVHFGSWRRKVGQTFLSVPENNEDRKVGQTFLYVPAEKQNLDRLESLSDKEMDYKGMDRLESLSYVEPENRPFTYREMAEPLAEYVLAMGFTHVEFLPLKEHPYGPSWGYQVSNYYAPSARYGTPDDLRYLIDYLHQRGIGVIMDWVPAHFPKDAFALGRFDGTALYEHLDPRKGEHPDWGTYIFNYGRNEVRNFLLANALYWFKEFHLDGLRVDAVASMLYLDYSRKEGEWVPNQFGGRENLEAISLLKELNEAVHRACPGAMMIAEESTAWPQVSHPVYAGGLGFDFKWNMGWMHDTLKYFQTDPLFRVGNHNALTFGLIYAWSENFLLPFSHDEVVHMKGSLLNKMPGSTEQKFANLRALYGYMWMHPGKKLLFMGGEFGQWREWNETESLDWHLLEDPAHQGVQDLVRDLNRIYQKKSALWQVDGEPEGFQWIDANNAAENIVSFIRRSRATEKSKAGRELICVGNFAPVLRENYQLGLPRPGTYRLIANTDAETYGGSGVKLPKSIKAKAEPIHGQPYSAAVTLPPLATLWFEAPKPSEKPASG
ncbi:MAG TPA: 1,4-alpha-glucan branching protein GlgB [Pyrinomonadaceae bacterium]|jgi:1,4-alpha-glucan branching enzyme|nr:1,4-alpha-glucan branching protein GlgB [Pyrinomonadaceae bacterium]